MSSKAYLGNPSKTSEILRKFGISAQKRYGQNFLVDSNILEKIVNAAGITGEDTVLEIGPGTGTLTERMLAAGARVQAIELDHRLAGYLRDERFKDDKVKMTVALLGMLVFSVLFQADYGCMGYAFIPMLYLLRDNTLFQAVVACGMLPSHWIGGSAFIPISMYNGKRGFIKGSFGKYFFYAFYPLHLLAIYLFKTIL